MGPPYHMIYPEMDLDLNVSSSGGVLPGFTFDWSCGPQFASINAVMDFGLSRNFMNVLIFDVFELVKAIPYFLAPRRYRTTRFAASICPLDG